MLLQCQNEVFKKNTLVRQRIIARKKENPFLMRTYSLLKKRCQNINNELVEGQSTLSTHRNTAGRGVSGVTVKQSKLLPSNLTTDHVVLK